MRTRGLIFSSREMLPVIQADQSLQQVANVATLPGIVGPSLAMPDIHWGYGFAIGGVAAFDLEEGVVSPGGVGYDINCGVRLLRTRLSREQVAPLMEALVNALFSNIPSGVGSRRQDFKLTGAAFKKVLKDGARWAVKEGFGEAGDLAHIEAGGAIAGADPEAVSDFALNRGKDQLGTLGSGNHFVEVGYVDEIYDAALAAQAGAVPGPGDGHRPHRLPGAGAPGVRGLHQGDAQGQRQVRHRIAGPAAVLRPPDFAGRPALPGGHGRGRQLRLCQPAADHPLGAGEFRAGFADGPPGFGAGTGLRCVPQHRQDRDSHRGGQAPEAVRPPQGRDPGLSAAPPGGARGLPGDRAAGAHPRGHGALLVSYWWGPKRPLPKPSAAPATGRGA